MSTVSNRHNSTEWYLCWLHGLLFLVSYSSEWVSFCQWLNSFTSSQVLNLKPVSSNSFEWCLCWLYIYLSQLDASVPVRHEWKSTILKGTCVDFTWSSSVLNLKWISHFEWCVNSSQILKLVSIVTCSGYVFRWVNIYRYQKLNDTTTRLTTLVLVLLFYFLYSSELISTVLNDTCVDLTCSASHQVWPYESEWVYDQQFLIKLTIILLTLPFLLIMFKVSEFWQQFWIMLFFFCSCTVM